nr:hypothetical protein [uncultured Methanoregula sp.]
MYRYIPASCITNSREDYGSVGSTGDCGNLRDSRCIRYNENSCDYEYSGDSLLSVRSDPLRWILYRYAEQQSALRDMRECM